jgi:hypothetical protein
MRLAILTTWPILALLALGSTPKTLTATEPTPQSIEFFEKKVRPILAQHCGRCHSTQAKKLKARLLLDSQAGLLKGGDGGPVIVPGQPDRSRLIDAVRYQNVDLRMPPRGKLPESAIADLTHWVQMGAPWPRETSWPSSTPTSPVFDLQKRKQAHWAWQPIRQTPPPAVKDRRWPRDPIDAFLLAHLEEKELAPAPPADRRTLIRRVYLDLIGLPPTPTEVDAFVNDDSPAALEKVVDRLLSSVHFGERWGRHWLDVVRYAETRGHEYDYPAPNAYQYRDYVIRALNADVPYHRFVTEHIAGDLLDQPRLHPVEGFNESILGTGFWLLGEELHSPVDVRQDQADRFDNRIDVMTKTFLGLTVACARCHDHKFDAISTRDYFALYGFLDSSSSRLVRFDGLEHNRPIAAELARLRAQYRPTLYLAVAESLRPAVDRVADYLLAAREALPVVPNLDESPQNHKLKSVILGHWVAALKDAARDRDHPLHPWSLAVKDPQQMARNLKAYIQEERRRKGDLAAAWRGPEVVVDYSKVKPQDWIQDGFTFGPGPVRAGDVLLGNDLARPIVKVFDRAAAVSDPTWDGLRNAAGAEKDPGALAAVPRSGRTLSTPTFTIKPGKVYVLVEGTGYVYAAVEGHGLIAGPLHGRLVQPLRTGPGFAWVGLDLIPYQGRRTHLQFTPAEGATLAVACVLQSAQGPGAVSPGNEVLRAMVAANAGSPEALAAGYREMLHQVLDRLASDQIQGSAYAAAYARLADWMVRRPDLFPLDHGPASKRLAAKVGPFLEFQARLTAKIRHESRLALALLDNSGVDEHVFIRGSYKAPGPVVPRRFLEALAGPDGLTAPRGSGRLELARQMTDPALNPLLARVMVNRVWHHLFGRGIVASVDNFGLLGERPTHPELLDYLADRFIQDGWSVKRLIRHLMCSSAYQMSSRPDKTADRLDPEDLLLHRMRVRRLEGEAIRDALLTVSGRLDGKLYGPPVPIYLTPFQQGRGRPESGPLDGDGRRSVYLAVRRNFLSPFLLAFDTPIPFSTVGRRTVSNVPAQSLILMNDPFVQQQSRRWAARVLAQGGSPAVRITRMYEEAFARPPTLPETAACLEFLARQAQLSSAPDEAAAWDDLAHALVNSKEFVFLN